MPTYEYECQKCHGHYERMQRITDDPLTECPGEPGKECEGLLKRLISQSSFVLKGSGWYVTDYARKGSNEVEKS